MRYSYLLLIICIPWVVSSCDYRSGRNEGKESGATETPSTKPPSNLQYTYGIFLENSGSMDGYVRGITDFEDAIYRLLIDISYLADTVQVNYVNSKVIPYASGIQSFINNLEPATFQQRGGNRSSSNLNQVFGKVLEEVNNQKMSLLISDCIFSIGGGDTEEKLNNQKISIYNTFRKKLQQEPFATLIIKLTSEFNGSYYNKNNQPVTLNGTRRPYYIWLMGAEEVISKFKDQTKPEALEGFEHTYMLSANTQELKPFFTVLSNHNKTGNFRTDRNFSGSDYVQGIQNAESASRGTAEGRFGFSVAVDMSQIPVDSDYLTNIENYQINDSYQLVAIQPIAEINRMNSRDLAVIEGKATHVLTFMAKGKTFADLAVTLEKQTPAWVETTQTNDDIRIKNDSTQHDKTFGFGYLVAGVEEAYQNTNGQNAYFSFEVSVKK